jgi:hypothetical protein
MFPSEWSIIQLTVPLIRPTPGRVHDVESDGVSVFAVSNKVGAHPGWLPDCSQAAFGGAIRTDTSERATVARQLRWVAIRCGIATTVAAALPAVSKTTL